MGRDTQSHEQIVILILDYSDPGIFKSGYLWVQKNADTQDFLGESHSKKKFIMALGIMEF